MSKENNSTNKRDSQKSSAIKKHAKETPRKSEQMFKDLVEITTDWVWEVNAEGIYTYSSPKVKELLGYEPHEVIGKTPFDFMPKEEAKKITKVFSAIIAKKEPFYGLENINRHKDGHLVVLETNGIPIMDEKGGLKGYRGIDRDITERKEAENELKQAKEFIDNAINAQVDTFFVFDPKTGKAIRWNKSFSKISGYSDEEISVMKAPDSYYDREDLEKASEGLKKLAATGFATVELSLITKKGERIPFEYRASLIEITGGQNIAISIGRDITERKQAEQALCQSEERFRRSILESPFPIMIHAEDGEVLQINKVWTELTGYEPDEIPTLSAWTERAYGERKDIVKSRIDKIFDYDTRVEEGEYAISSRDGRTLIWDFSSAPLGILPDGRRLVISMAVDVTERKHTKEALQRIEWLLTKKLDSDQKVYYGQSYGNLVELNASRVLADIGGKDVLVNIVNGYLDLLETSTAVYEKNGDYAVGIFSSGWCRMLDQASRDLCSTDDNKEALASGKWHCHESCWTEASKIAIETSLSIDIECRGGIRIYAIPILAGGQVVGAINFGYGDPPRDRQRLREIAERYAIDVDKLIEQANAYESRPPFVIDLAKRRLATSAKLIGTMVERKQAEEELRISNQQLIAGEKEIRALAEFPAEDPNPVLRISRDSVILYANQASSPVLETWDRKVGQRLPDDCSKRIEEVFRSGKGSSFEFECLNGRLFLVKLAPIIDAGYVNAYGLDITERKNTELRQLLSEKILKNLNQKAAGLNIIRDILKLIKESIDFEAVGIRLREGDDFPYFAVEGFSDEFVEKENCLCSAYPDSEQLCDSKRKLRLECMCGVVLLGLTDASSPFFTETGSFYTNSTTELVTSVSPNELQCHLRGHCNSVGYESIALIPLRSADEIIGLLQLNDTHQGRFTLEMVHFFEGIGASIGTTLSRIRAEEELKRYRLHLEDQVKIRTEELTKSNEQLLQEIEDRKRLEKEILDISEREKRLIGRNLHDSIGQQLAGLSFMAEVLEQKLASKSLSEASYAKKITSLVHQSMNQARALARGLHPVDLEKNSLTMVLQGLAATMKHLFGIACTFEFDKPIEVDDTEVAIHLYRIAQEAVTNATKHGKAKNVQIRLISDTDQATLTIENDGLDFTKKRPSGKGMGLKIMEYRTEMINGTLDIRKRKEGGTILTCVFPNNKN